MRHYDVVAAEPGEAGGHSSLLLNAAENSSRRLCVRGSTSSTRSAGVIGDK